MKRKTFDVLLKRDDLENTLGVMFSVMAVSSVVNVEEDDVAWRKCPRIDRCNVANFLEPFFDKDGDTREFKVTFTEK